MPVGTVRGRYELDAPALRTLRDLERQGVRTQKQMDDLGRAMDQLGDRGDQQRLRDYERELSDFRRTTERTFRGVRREWVETTRVVRVEAGRQERALDALIAKMDILSAKRVSPQIDVDGIAAAIAQVEVLHSRINSLGRASASPSVRTVGAGGGGGGGGLPGSASVGGVGGSFGGGGRGLRSIGVGPATFGSAGGIALLASLLPAAVQVGGAAGAVLGSAGMGALGAGALGATAFGGLGAGVGLTVAGARGAQGQITEAAKAMAKFRDVVADYGRASKEAARAKRELDQAMAAAPEGTRELLRQTSSFRERWQDATAPARRNWVSTLSSGIRTGNQLLPALARGSNRTTGAVARESSSLGRWLGGGIGQRGIRQGAGIFDENLGAVRGTGQNVFETWINVIQASRPFFRESTEWLERWTSGWASGTRDISETREDIGRMVDHLRSWVGLTGATGGLLGSLLGTGAPEGQRAVEDLTLQFARWEAWIDQNPAKVQDFFRRSVDGTKDLAAGLWEVVEALGRLGDDLGPLLSHFMQLVDLAGSLGMLTPGATTLAYGAYRGFRGAGGGLGGGGGRPVAGGGAGGGAGGMGGGLGAGMGLGAAWSNWRTNRQLRSTASYGATLAARDAARGSLASRAAQGSTLRGAMVGAGSTYGLARSFGYGRGSSLFAGLGSTRVAGLAGAGLRGAGRAYLPIAAVMAGLDALSFQGDQTGLASVPGRLHAAASSATLGAIGRPKDRAYYDDESRHFTQGTLRQLSRGNSVSGLQNDVATLQRRERNLEGTGDFGSGRERSRRIADVRAAFQDEIEVRRQMAQDLRERRRADARARGGRAGQEWIEGFGRRQRRGGTERAFDRTIGDIRGEIATTGKHRGRGIAEEVFPWALGMGREDDRLKDEVAELEKTILRRFGGMARRVAVINGEIFTGTKREWGSIADAMASAARRGVDRTSEEFQRLRSVAIGSLVAMGFTRGEARQLFRGGMSQNRAVRKATAGAAGAARRGEKVDPRVISRIRQHTNDPAGDGIGDGLGDRTGGKYASRVQASGAMGGGLMGANAGLGKYAGLAASHGLRVSSGLRSGAVTSYGNRSFHATGDALDVAGPPDAMRSFAMDAARRYGSQLEELIYSPLGWSIKNGRRVPAYAVKDHYDHVHLADTAPGAAGRGIRGGGGGLRSGAGLRLNARMSGQGGAFGAMNDAARSGYARGIEAAAAGLGVGGGGGGGQWAAMVRRAGLPSIFNAIIAAESGGDPRARNPSGASGLAQIMMPLHSGLIGRLGGNVFDPWTNLRAAKALYEQSGLAPWAASRAKWAGAFDRGGSFLASGPTMFMAGEGPRNRRERVSVTPLRRRSAAGRIRGGGGVQVSFAGATFHVRDDSDIERIATAVGTRILAALDGDQVGEEEING